MMKHTIRALALSVLFISASSNVFAGDQKAAVQTLYDFLNNPVSQVHEDKFLENSTEAWESLGDYSGNNKKRVDFIGALSGFYAKLIPDFKLEIQEMIQEGNTVVVRGRATGTPNGPLFGVDGEGRSFDILTIDIHTLEDGKIATSYHVEDWAGAMHQLGGK